MVTQERGLECGSPFGFVHKRSRSCRLSRPSLIFFLLRDYAVAIGASYCDKLTHFFSYLGRMLR